MAPDSLRKLFRGLLVAQLIWGVILGIVQETTKKNLPFALREYFASQPGPSALELTVGGVAIVLTIALTVGLYRFSRLARTAYVAFYPLSAIVAAFMPPVVQSGLVSALYSIGATVSGVIIGIAFFSPIASDFGARGSESAA